MDYKRLKEYRILAINLLFYKHSNNINKKNTHTHTHAHTMQIPRTAIICVTMIVNNNLKAKAEFSFKANHVFPSYNLLLFVQNL